MQYFLFDKLKNYLSIYYRAVCHVSSLQCQPVSAHARLLVLVHGRPRCLIQAECSVDSCRYAYTARIAAACMAMLPFEQKSLLGKLLKSQQYSYTQMRGRHAVVVCGRIRVHNSKSACTTPIWFLHAPAILDGMT